MKIFAELSLSAASPLSPKPAIRLSSGQRTRSIRWAWSPNRSSVGKPAILSNLYGPNGPSPKGELYSVALTIRQFTSYLFITAPTNPARRG